MFELSRSVQVRRVGALVASLALAGSVTLAMAASSVADPVDDAHRDVRAKVPVRVLDPTSLERGRDARILHLQDGVIRRAGGKRVRLDIPKHHDRQVVLGRQGGGFLVASERGAVQRVHRVRKGRKTLVTKFRGSHEHRREYVGFRLSRTKEALVRHVGGAYANSLRVLDPQDGSQVAGWPGRAGDFENLLDVADGHVWANAWDLDDDREELFDWQPGVGVESLAGRAIAVFGDRDLAFVNNGRRDHGPYGPTSLSHPGEPVWRAQFAPLDVSPNGEFVLGARIPGKILSTKRRVLQVRRMSDGHVLQAFRYGSRHDPDDGWLTFEQTARFETNKKIVFQIDSGADHVLVRCARKGRCVRASATGGDVSFPFESYEW